MCYYFTYGISFYPHENRHLIDITVFYFTDPKDEPYQFNVFSPNPHSQYLEQLAPESTSLGLNVHTLFITSLPDWRPCHQSFFQKMKELSRNVKFNMSKLSANQCSPPTHTHAYTILLHLQSFYLSCYDSITVAAEAINCRSIFGSLFCSCPTYKLTEKPSWLYLQNRSRIWLLLTMFSATSLVWAPITFHLSFCNSLQT